MHSNETDHQDLQTELNLFSTFSAGVGGSTRGWNDESGGPACGVSTDIERPLLYANEPSNRARSKGRSQLTRLSWLLAAVGLCWLSWPAPAEAQPACPHDICEEGSGMPAGCDPCVTSICEIDAYCCESLGDGTISRKRG